MNEHKIIFINKTTPCPVLEIDFIEKEEDQLHFAVQGRYS
jgi:hypothetical protein